jgi:BolA protein
MSVKETIETKLNAALDPVRLDVVDDSESHRGHGGWREGGETHFNLIVVSGAFAGQSRVARQRLVLDALSEEMAGPVHALSMQCHTPEEARKLAG